MEYKNHTTPVETKSEYVTYGIILAVLAVIILLTTVLIIYNKSRSEVVVKHEKGNFTANIHNKTAYPILFNNSFGTHMIKPNDTLKSSIIYHEKLKANGVTEMGSTLDFNTRLASSLNDLYITETGFGHENVTNKHGALVNNSNEDVIFTLVSPYGGKRFPTTVLANSSVSNVTMMKGQKWHVVTPKETHKVLSEKIARKVPNIIYFDGKDMTIE